MYCENILLKDWVVENPTTNPFTNCRNVTQLGGSDVLWAEFQYRYKNEEIYSPDDFVAAVERCFIQNEYKYTKMLASMGIIYNPLNNYLVNKEGSEVKTLNLSKGKTGTETVTPNLTTTSTPHVTTTTTETPTLKIKETQTPVETPTVKTKTTETPRVEKTITTTPADYTDSTSKTTFDNTQDLKAVQSVSRVYDAQHPETTTEVPTSGTNETTNEVVSGNTRTVTSHTGDDETETVTTGTNEKVTEYLSGNTQTIKSQTGSDTVTKTGTESTQYNTTVSDTGTDTLSFNARKDSGYMYRNPQDVVEDERKIANFSLIDVIMIDVEAVTLISVY